MKNPEIGSLCFLSLIAHLTETAENLWVFDQESSQNDIDFTNLIFNHIDDTDCVTLQIVDGEVSIDSLRNDSLFDGSLGDLVELHAELLQDQAA